ncbi:hypothetical protein NEPAR06_0329 [Nematocida parisii]|uniref:DDT domain-containing protein n=1 Tax=Nematocida parisii (strain ERTm3) TaxID=935791 RepID=I3EGB8_NEMP3|nr:uncharacterized protein NEPG_01240 [Nematocida parisii ERTm1]EIJ88265.1 hypothetical protein NEQG_01709 [Nematocida parisii ERTm3]KAI5142316.1 hypothetical protein NEPAR07_0058 [Nematocida parisii]EIJ93669.1 hypothetical protein NEPG_01240 [Nematocida parisii ERTm1]KAI5153293.1 hypothetical protein NEPAR06_0329 [Nematocida parisii]KAI5155673.1 hypothetical protein NEPAR05_0044 [Nematocida parisii]|eukprot:XP_013059068.1 hypothetical protein NEPG_01240 [Nematocida parisii ERTm1]
MIESIALRKFAVSYFLVHPTKPLCNLVNRITTTIKNRFFIGEVVFIKNKELTGQIVKITKKGYIVEIHDDETGSTPQREEILAQDLLRKDSATKNEVLLFILSITKDTPLGRIVANNIIQELGIFKGQKPIIKQVEKATEQPKVDKNAWLTPPNQEKEKEKLKELSEIEEARVQKKTDQILSIYSEKWEHSSISTHKLYKKVISLYNGLNIFCEFLKTKEMSLEEFISAVFAEKDTPRLVDIFSKLLKAISHERRKSGKEGLKDMLHIASNMIYESEHMKEVLDMITIAGEKKETGFNRIQWFAGDAAQKTWLAYIKSFVYDIMNIYDIKVKTNEFMPYTPTKAEKTEKVIESLAVDRLLMISFMFETIILGVRFRTYYDTLLEEYKEKERERLSLVQEVKRLKGEVLVNEGADEVKEQIEEAEKKLEELNTECKPEAIRSGISKYGDINFILVDGKLVYEYNEAFFIIQEDKWESFISLFDMDKKKDLQFVETVKRYLRIFQ